MSGNRVVITGMGVLAANGNNLSSFWASLKANRSGVAYISSFDASELGCRVAGEVKNFVASSYFTSSRGRRPLSRSSSFAVACADMALANAGLSREQLTRGRQIPVVLGVATSEMVTLEDVPNSLTATHSMPGSVAAAIGQHVGLDPRVVTVSDACASSAEALTIAFDFIRAGFADVALAGGAEASITRYTLESFLRAGCVGEHRGDPSQACRPFDEHHRWSVLAEGAGVVVLESLAHALARGVRPFAEISGHGVCVDRPGRPGGSGLETSMGLAVSNACRLPRDIDYINAHGPGDLRLDRQETIQIKNTFGTHAYAIPIASIKGATGSPLGTAGVMQTIATALTIRNEEIPPTTNLRKPDPECDLDFVAERSRMNQVRCAMVNSHGANGSNVSLVLEALD